MEDRSLERSYDSSIKEISSISDVLTELKNKIEELEEEKEDLEEQQTAQHL